LTGAATALVMLRAAWADAAGIRVPSSTNGNAIQRLAANLAGIQPLLPLIGLLRITTAELEEIGAQALFGSITKATRAR
jgi:hypothetical protein